MGTSMICGQYKLFSRKIRIEYRVLLLLSGFTIGIPYHIVAAQKQTDQNVLASITTDTGYLAPGNRDFSRYTIPALCVSAARTSINAARHSLTAQAAALTSRDSSPETDTLPAAVVAIAQRCGEHFTLDNTASKDWPDLFSLLLVENHDQLANAVTSRRLAMAKSEDVRVEVLFDVIDRYLNASPARILAAESTIAAIDALGPREQLARMQAHGKMITLARQAFDKSIMRREAAALMKLSAEVPDSAINTIQRAKGDLYHGYAALGGLAMIYQPDSLIAVAQLAKKDLGRFGRMPNGIPVEDLTLLADISKWSLSDVQSALVPELPPDTLKHGLPPLETTHWFPGKPAIWPAHRGQAALIFNEHCCTQEEQQYIRQWGQEYGDRLSIIIVYGLRGAELGTLPLSPTAEADSIAWFDLNYLKLPATIAVVEDSVWQLSAPDRRRVRYDTAYYAAHHDLFASEKVGPKNWNIIFIGHDGRVRYISDYYFYAPMLRTLIAQDLAAPALGRPADRVTAPGQTAKEK